VSGIEYGYRARRVSPRTGSRWAIEAVCPDLDTAKHRAAGAVTEEPGWESEVTWRVPASPWQKWDPRPEAEGSEFYGEILAPDVLSSLLMLVEPAVIPPEVIATWTTGQRAEVQDWAAAEHLIASDNNDVKPREKPDLLDRAAEISSSPAMAQLAVEAWTGRPSQFDYMDNPEKLTAMAQDAITGLVVLGLRATGGKERA
jgi:hypothetical protein